MDFWIDAPSRDALDLVAQKFPLLWVPATADAPGHVLPQARFDDGAEWVFMPWGVWSKPTGETTTDAMGNTTTVMGNDGPFYALARWNGDPARLPFAQAGGTVSTDPATGVGVADQVTLTGTLLSMMQGTPKGSFIIDAAWTNFPGYKDEFAVHSGNGALSIDTTSASHSTLYTNTGTVTLGSGTIDTGARVGFSWDTSSQSAAANGGSVVTAASGVSLSGQAVGIGWYVSVGYYLDGYIRKIAYYNKRLPDPSLQYRTGTAIKLGALDDTAIPDWLRHSFAANDNALLRMAMGD